MKIFSFIFAFYILFLSVQPSLRDIASSGKNIETCSCGSSCEPIEKKQPKKQTGNKDNKENKACNPFQVCKYCVGFNTGFELQNFTPMLFFAKPQAEREEKVPPQIALDFWQPPKIV